MSEAVDMAINNLSDMTTEFIKVVVHVLETVGRISQTVVWETASCGYIFTMMGLGLCCLAMVCIGAIFFLHTLSVEKKNQVFKDVAIGFLIVFAVAFMFLGMCMMVVNLPNWIAPTKQVVLEVIKTIN